MLNNHIFCLSEITVKFEFAENLFVFKQMIGNYVCCRKNNYDIKLTELVWIVRFM